MLQVESAVATELLVSPTDYVELSRLVLEHGWRTDHGRADTIHELYVDNGELVLPPTHLRGREAIREWGRQLVQFPPWRSIRHVCGNMRFVVDGPNSAHGTTVLTVFMVAGTAAAMTVPFSVGEDHDRFVRTEQGWRLLSRRWEELFARGDVLNLPQNGRDTTD
jgi:hypothetical protein